jgi:hypothetical protein
LKLWGVLNPGRARASRDVQERTGFLMEQLVDVDVVVLRNITSKPHGSNENNNKTEVTPMIYGSVSYI